ncbi:30S ribosomal protein S6 [Candidatus Parcubacteria bacterium]|nr:30S ribosomal protein S6 [Candidatus Parcubacteria bacterium]
MNNYELLYILPVNMAGKEIKNVFLEVEKNILKMGGEKLETLLDHPFLIKTEVSKEEESEELKDLPIVKRKMAYYVKKNKFGFYCLFNFSSEPENLKEIEAYLRMNNNVLRHLITQADPMSKEERKELEKLFTRKRAEQEKEKGRERKEKKDVKKEEKKVEKEIKKPQEIKIAELPTKEEFKKIEEKAEKVEREDEKKDVEKEIKKDDPKEKNKQKETESKKKKKMKLEDLEDKLDEILEDTNI